MDEEIATKMAPVKKIYFGSVADHIKPDPHPSGPKRSR